MAGTGDALEFSATSVVEDVLQQHGKRLSDIDLASRRAEEDSTRRYEAAGWLRKTVGVVAAKDLPAEPSEEDFRLGLRSGIILCNVLNKIQSGAVPKVVEAPSDSLSVPDGAALSAFQYFENVRNFLVAVEELGLPTFEASDLEQGGKSSRIVNCVLALKSYSDWKKGGGNGSWKFGGNLKPCPSGKQFVRKTSEPFSNVFLRSTSIGGDKSSDIWDQCSDRGSDLSQMGHSQSLHMLVRDLLQDKKPEEIPIIVENMLSKVTEEFERRLANQQEQINATTVTKDSNGLHVIETLPRSHSHSESLPRTRSEEMKPSICHENDVVEENESPKIKNVESPKIRQVESPKVRQVESPKVRQVEFPKVRQVESPKVRNVESPKINKVEYIITKDPQCEKLKAQAMKQQALIEQHHKELQELKQTLSTAKEDLQSLQMSHQEEVNNLGKHLRNLAQAASGYKKVVEENRKLYNLVQDLKGNIRVYCRVRPFHPGQASRLSSVDYLDEGTLTVLNPSKNGKDGKKTFNFNRVFGPSATQAEVFSDTQPLIRSVLDGYNVCIFAYGQTGSGKTHTMTGPQDLTPETMGVNYRALNDLFLISKERKDMIAYEVSVQMLEIYNEQVRDLLMTDGTNKRLEIRNGSQKGINVPDANLVPVTSTDEVIYLMNLGHKNRAVGFTAMNDRSSRSHSCLMVHVSGRDLTTGTTVRGCMHLVDLAGSERVDKSEVLGDRLKEAQHINKSLAALGDVIASLAQKNAHVPYRNSKLTQLLQDSLGGQAKTLMFVHISPDAEAIGETISTLKFAERVSTIELGAAKSNKEGADVRELKEQIAVLKAALARKDGGNRSKSPTQDSIMTTSTESSPSHHKLGAGRQPMEEVGNTEVRFSKQNKSSPDLHSLTDGGKEAGFGDWEDKVMVNKQNGVWEDDNKKMPDMFYQKFTPDSSKIYPEQPLFNVTDESDDRDTTTSDCSETDCMWQVNVPKGPNNNMSNGVASKIKKPNPRQAKNPESRIPAPPTRRLSNGGVSPAPKMGRQHSSLDGRKRNGK